MGTMTLNTRLLLSTALLGSLLGAPVQAQNTAPPSEAMPAASDDIIVTANKREERIQDVALSISAVSGDELIRRQALDIQDLAQRVAGLNFQQGGNIAGAGLRIVLRGLNTGGNGSTVASVFDDSPLTFSGPVGGDRAADIQPYDLSRVEVLRGPQGSLYGANAMGGLIKYVSNPPRLDRTEGGVDVGISGLRGAGDIGYSGRGFVNLPIATDKAALRVSGFYENSPGWIDNKLGGREDTNGFKRFGGRASLLLEPNDKLSVRLTATYQKLEAEGVDGVEVGGTLVATNPFQPLKGNNLDTYLDQPSDKETQTYIGNLTYDVGGATLQSITSYTNVENRITNDVPIYAYAFGGLLLGRPGTTLFYDTQIALKKFNQEFRIASDNDAAKSGGLQWQAGLFFTNEDVDQIGQYFTRDTITGARVTTPASPDNALVIDARQAQRYREYAAYADATYFFSPQFDIEFGGRVFKNTQRSNTVQGGALIGGPIGTDIGTLNSKQTSATFAVAPRYHFTPDVMVYARVASGYRPGGPQNIVPNAPAGLPSTFQEDTTINYEAGLKGSFFDRVLSVDVAAFYIDWKDIQVNVVLPFNGIGYSIVQNAGKAVSKGLEFNIGVNPMRGLSLSAIGAYTDAKLTRDAPGIGGFDGDQLPYVPKFGLTLTADYEWSLSDTLDAYVGGSFSHTSQRFNNYALDPSISHLSFPGYDTFAAQAGVRKGSYGLQLYGKNLTNKRGITSYYGGQAILGTTIPAQIGVIRPREIGLRLTAGF